MTDLSNIFNYLFITVVLLFHIAVLIVAIQVLMRKFKIGTLMFVVGSALSLLSTIANDIVFYILARENGFSSYRLFVGITGAVSSIGTIVGCVGLILILLDYGKLIGGDR